MENTSGQGHAAEVPAEIQRWNWGAFLLNWIWGIGNNTLIALLMFVPFANFVMPFILGARGNEWAWRNKRWDSVEQFRRIQRQWSIWGGVIFVLFIGLMAAIIISVMAMMKSTVAYQMGYQKLVHNPQAVAVLGTPIKTGFPLGNIQITGSTGKADISFSVEGPKAKGTVYVDATRDMGQWNINRAELAVDGRTERINLNP